MRHAIAFIYGSASFYAGRFFPLTILLLSILFLVLSVRQNLLDSRHVTRHRLTPVYAVVLMALLGFYSAYLRSSPPEDISALSGRTIVVEGNAHSEAVPLDSRPGSFSQFVDITGAVDKSGRNLSLKQVRVISDGAMTPGLTYRITVKVPSDAFFMNP